MLGLLVLANIASFIAFVVGLINPKLVLRGDKRTRLKSSLLYFGVFLASGFTAGVLAPKKSEPIAVTPIAKPRVEAKSTPTTSPILTTKEVKLTSTPTPTVAPASVAFDPAVCNTGDYLPVNGASIALYTTCQYININSLKPESVSVVTGANDKNNAEVQELRAESGFEGVTWRDYTLDPESKRDVCVEYKDESVSCFTFSNPNQTAGVQIQPSDSANIPTGSKCEDFAIQAHAQAALQYNPKLDRDGDGIACNSLSSGGSGSRHTGSHRRRRR
jgi:Excalibur calcium-binding domain